MAINHFRNIYSGIMDRALALSVMLVLFAGNLSAQRDTIVEGSEIGVVKVTVENTNPPMRMRGNGSMRISTEYMSELPKILGNGDPMRLMQMMPGIQVNSEYDSGIHIQGCENSHNYLSIDGAPIYNASHLLGFFSIFNPDYFSSVDISKSP
ncbi:MAG: Plug domain-containing protein, partial [Bacteroidales bacterium]|nr:Plug domain-containing protein [Bacteroidales bacterium]